MATDNAQTKRFLAMDWSTSLKEAGLILALSLVAMGAWWALRSERLPLQADPAYYELELEAPLLTIDDALSFYDEGVHLFVDTRDVNEGTSIPGAFFIRAESFDDNLLENFDFMFPEDELILFGDGNLSRTSNIAARLKGRGYLNLHILQGGFSAWIDAGGESSSANTGGGS
ncbi:MAG: rhodanese-related sulfurtransferase [Candidatus Krumholzibacteriia bacterium]|jgi:rhodanese-related sulfurtransferase